MNMKRSVSALLLVGSLMTWLPSPDAFAATAALPDLTDFITRLAGYLFVVKGDIPTALYWSQVSYKVTGPTSPSNITTITVTRYPKAMVYKISGNPMNVIPQLTATSTSATQLSPCEVADYVVETVTLDLRDLKIVTSEPRQALLKLLTPVTRFGQLTC
jgi:hypothetical protein